MVSMNPEDGTSHRTAGRVLDILEHLAAAPQGCALRDLSRDLTAPKSSLLPLLRTLVGRGYASRDSAGNYHLGEKVLQLSAGSLTDIDLRDVARPLLADLTRRTGESTILATLTGDEQAVVYIDRVEGTHRIRVAAAIGELRPLHSTASGRLLLAWLPKERREAIIKCLRMTRFTSQTITSKSVLRQELERIRRDGFCINTDQSVIGHCTIGAPIFDREGNAVAACVLSAPKDRVWSKLAVRLREVLATAGMISERLGYQPRKR